MTKRWVSLVALLTILCLPSFGLAELAVFDDNGKRVGPVVGFSGGNSDGPIEHPQDVWVSFEIEEVLVTLLFNRTNSRSFNLGLLGMERDQFFFESTDCFGPMLINRNPDTFALWST